MTHGSVNRGRHGFSLMELFVVMIVIVLLLAMLLPVITQARRRARTVQGLNHLKQLTSAVQSFALDHDRTLPMGWKKTGPDATDWSVQTVGYLTTSEEIYNPSGNELPSVYRDPNATFAQGQLHYSAHPILMPDYDWTSQAPPDIPLYKMSRLRRPDQVILIMDGVQNPNPPVGIQLSAYSCAATAYAIDNGSLYPDSWADPSFAWVGTKNAYQHRYKATDTDNETPIYPYPTPMNADNPENQDTAAQAGKIRWRQAGGTKANFAFIDGHAQTLAPAEVTKKNIRVD